MPDKDLVCKKCGVINCFHIVEKSGHKIAYCDACGAYIKHIAFNKQKFYFGKHKGKYVEDIQDRDYLLWFLNNIEKISPAMRESLEKRVTELTPTP